jgi:ankyrin repeat protein
MDPLSIAGSIAGVISLSDTIFRKLYRYVKDVKSAEKEVQDLKNEVAALNGVLHNLHLIAQDLESSSLENHSIRPDHINSCLDTLYQLDEKINKAGIFDKGTPLYCAVYDTWVMFPDDYEGDHLFDDECLHTISVLLEAGATPDADVVHERSLSYAISYGPMSLLTEMVFHGMPVRPDVIKYIEGMAHQYVEEYLGVIECLKNVKLDPDIRMHLLNIAREYKIGTTVSVPDNEAMNDRAFTEAVIYTVKFGPASTLHTLTTDQRFFVNMKESESHGTLLHLAAKHNSSGCVELLLDKDFDPGQLDELGWTVLHHAVNSGMEQVHLIRRLIETGIGEIADCGGRNVWHIAAERGSLDVLGLLVSHYGPGCPYSNVRDEKGMTPLLLAIIWRHSQFAAQLLRSLSLRKTCLTDPRILPCVVASGLGDLLRELLETGVEFHPVSDNNHSALYFITKYTSPIMIKILIDHGLDVNQLDSCGKTPLIDVLERDQHSQRLKALGYSDFEFTIPNPYLVELLATHFSACSQDKEGNSVWFYFCAKTISRNLLLPVLSSEREALMLVSDILIRQGALSAYEEATTHSGIALLIEVCLDSILKTSKEHQKAASICVVTLLRHVLGATTVTSLLTSHPQAVRLLIWSTTQPENEILEQLLKLGVDVHATCEHYGDDSAIDVSIKSEIKLASFGLILAHAEPSRIPKLDANGSMRHFVLCDPPDSMKEEHMTQISKNGVESKIATASSKIQAMLKRGLDPNAKSTDNRTAAHFAARAGHLESIKALVAHHVDLGLMDSHGWTVIHAATATGQIAVLKYLRQTIKNQEEWERRIAFDVPLIGPHHVPLGPLSNQKYLRGTLAHLAACNSSSDCLRFLRENNILGDIDAKTQEGVTPLHLAVCISSPQTTRWLLENGADVNAKCGTRDISALHIALRRGCLVNAIALIEAGAEFFADSAGVTPEMQVHPQIRANLIEVLLHIGVGVPPGVIDVIRRDHERESYGSLFRAIVEGDPKACSTIIANVPHWDKPLKECGSCTPLITALAYGRVGIVRLFLDHGASTSGTTCPRIRSLAIESHSALDLAVQRPIFNEILEQLLENCLSHEAHWSQKVDCWRPLHFAAALNPAAIEIIIQHVLKHVSLFRYAYLFPKIISSHLRKLPTPGGNGVLVDMQTIR